MHTFTDPSNSPGQHARDLRISGLEPLTAASTWVRSFRHIEKLLVRTYQWEGHPEASLVQLHGLSDTLRSLYLSHVSLPLSKVFDLVCSFPLLESLALRHEGREIDTDGWVTPLTSPKLTGSLHLMDEIRSVRALLDLPGGLRFTKITIRCFVEDAESAMDLVSRCSGTLESLCIDFHSAGRFPSIPGVDKYFNTVHQSRCAEGTSPARPFQGTEAQRHRVSIRKPECSVDCRDASDCKAQIPSPNHHLLICHHFRDRGNGPSGVAEP